jgi:hypothetical protein
MRFFTFFTEFLPNFMPENALPQAFYGNAV